MSEDKSRVKYLLEKIESIMKGGVKVPRDVLLGKAYQWNHNVQIVKDEPAIEISKT